MYLDVTTSHTASVWLCSCTGYWITKVKDTYNSLINNHLNSGYNEKQYLKFKTHWRAISTQMAFGALAKTSPDKYFEIRNYLEEELNKKDKKIQGKTNKKTQKQ